MSFDTTPDTTRVQGGSCSGQKARLLSLHDIDRRTRAYQKTVELIGTLEVDAGGSDRLSTGERQLIQRAACTGAMLEDIEARWLAGQEIDPSLYAMLGNAQRRYLECVGLRRVPHDVSASADRILAYADIDEEPA